MTRSRPSAFGARGPSSGRREVLAGLAAAAWAGLAGCGSLRAAELIPGYPGMVLNVPPPRRDVSGSPYPDLIGRIYYYIAERSDTLVHLARKHDLGYTELVAANQGIDPWLPEEGTRILLPTAHLLPAAERDGLVLNLADQRLYYFRPGTGEILSYPIGIGSEGWGTPLGDTKIVRKKAGPTWYVPKSIREQNPELPAVVPPGPDNPLGTHALYLGWPAYLIHGTNKPLGVGRRASHGCIRLYPEDIVKLFETTKPDTPVRVVDQPVKLGWVDGDLVLEIHPSQSQADELEAEGKFTPAPEPELEFRVLHAAGDQADRLDWDVIRNVASARTGVPTRIFKPLPTAAASSSG